MRRRCSDDDGASAIELAVLAPVLLVVIFSIVQVGLWAYGRNVALDAAQHGVSELRLYQPARADVGCGATENDTIAYAKSLGGAGLAGPDATAAYSGAGGGRCAGDPNANEVQVTVTGRAVSLVPGLTLTVTRTASGRIEQFQNDG